MFSKLFTITVLAAATTGAIAAPQGGQQDCQTGQLQCCEQVGNATDPGIANELGILGIVLQDIDALVGLTCSPISVSNV